MTIVAPVGISKKNEKHIPSNTEKSETMDPTIRVLLKLFPNCKAVTTGNINNADTNIIPTILT